MDSSSDDETAMIIGAATSALAAGYAVLEAYRSPIVITRPPHINRDQARENYMDSILYGSSSYCIDQIRMDQDTFFRLLNTLTVRDAGYGIRNGFIPPYIGVRYHLKEYDGNPPQNEKELFNLRHSSLRTTIERGFGILKKRFRVIDNDPFWDFKTQVDVVLACCILHNHIMGITPNDRFIQEMGRKGEKQFRWSKPMEHMMLQILAEEVKLGNRPNNNFRQSSFTRVVDAIKEKFGATCLPDHVENHLRTVRASWSTIVAIRGRSGFSWIEDLKMIIASPTVYHDYIQKNPSHDKFIHKKIDFYDEMALVVGKDMATGSFGKTFTDINLGAPLTVDDAVNNITELVMQKEIPYSNASSSETNTSSCGAKQHRKRNRSSDEIEKISERLGEVAAALTQLSTNKLDVSSLYDEIMKMKGYEEEFLASVFDHLVQNEMLAKSFIVKSDRLRLNFLEDFKKQRQT
ncbi:hypothetical protein ACH5RR_010280 [Cinchona calisaya]|uniref:Myb/SANT-like domain-containing protein n=1 Tax=Cinchona calisaya TaxID=153742 RepID=A0ABD3AIL2_9GENT